MNTIRVSKGLDPDKDRHFVGPALGPSCLQRLQFHIHVDSYSPVNDCPLPDQEKELVILDYSCYGGITWHILKTFSILEYREPQ